jgi:hypothetical protein
MEQLLCHDRINEKHKNDLKHQKIMTDCRNNQFAVND